MKKKLKAKLSKAMEKEIENEIEQNLEEKMKEKEQENATKLPDIHPFSYEKPIKLIEKLRIKQVKKTNKKLKRYSKNFFDNYNKPNTMSIPTPQWYKISAGDIINITLIEAKGRDFKLEVKKDGTVIIPSYGKVKVAGISFKQASKKLKYIFKKNYPNSKPIIEIGKYSTIQVAITGEAKIPGIYNLSSLTTLKEALVQCKGISDNGSVRNIKIIRKGKTVAKIDLYDMLVRGNDVKFVFLKQGDIINIPVAKILVKISGEVKQEGIYELKKDENLQDLFSYAGGLKQSANKSFISPFDRYCKRYLDSKSGI
jgi:protein involved in polysaccharide export with SLBB domain